MGERGYDMLFNGQSPREVGFKVCVALLLGCLIPLGFVMHGCGKEPRPESLGWYAVSRGELVSLAKSSNVGSARVGRDKLFGLSVRPEVPFDDLQLYFIVFDVDAPGFITDVQLSRLGFVGNTGIIQEDAEINLWRPLHQVQLEVVPSQGESRMFILRPTGVLTPGPYTLHIGNFELDDWPDEKPACYPFLVEGELTWLAQMPVSTAEWPDAFLWSYSIHPDDWDVDYVRSVAAFTGIDNLCLLRTGSDCMVISPTEDGGEPFMRPLVQKGFTLEAEQSAKLRNWQHLPEYGYFTSIMVDETWQPRHTSFVDSLLLRYDAEFWSILAFDNGFTTFITDIPVNYAWPEELGAFEVLWKNIFKKIWPVSEPGP